MKRFIDLRGQHTLHRFAWWDTVRDEFEKWAGDFAWDTWDEFEESVQIDRGELGVKQEHLARYRRLCPPWVFEEPHEDDDRPCEHPDPFRPFGYSTGHGIEWCPVCGALRAPVWSEWRLAERGVG